MARALGVSCTSNAIFFALADDRVLVEHDTQVLRAPELFEETEGLRALQDAVGRVITETRADIVRVLLPEATYKGSYMALLSRAALETLVRLGAQRSGVPVELLHRNTARSRLGMPRRGKFEDLIASVIPNRVGDYWAQGRSLAATAAVADAD